MVDDQRSQFAAMIVAILVIVKFCSLVIMGHDRKSSLKGDFQEVLTLSGAVKSPY